MFELTKNEETFKKFDIDVHLYTSYAVYMGFFLYFYPSTTISPFLTGNLWANGPATLGSSSSKLRFSSDSTLEFNPTTGGAAIYDDTTPFAPYTDVSGVDFDSLFDPTRTIWFTVYHGGACNTKFYSLELTVTTEY